MCHSLFLIKLHARGLQRYQKETLVQVFLLVNFAKFLRAPFLTEKLRWSLLKISLPKFQ